MELQRSWNDGAKMFQVCFIGVLKNFQGSCCFMKVWRVLQERLKSVLRMFQGSFMVFLSALMMFHDCLKLILRRFDVPLNVVLVF